MSILLELMIIEKIMITKEILKEMLVFLVSKIFFILIVIITYLHVSLIIIGLW